MMDEKGTAFLENLNIRLIFQDVEKLMKTKE
jgi:hypothetical protein